MGVLLSLSPLSGAGRVWLSWLLGVSAAVAIWGFERWRRHRDPQAPPPPMRWEVPAAVLAALAALALAFAPTLAWLYTEHTFSVWRTVHGLFVPIFACLLARSALRADPRPEAPETSAWGWLFVGAGLALAVVDAAVRSHHLAAIGLLLCLPGVSLLFLGARRTRLIAVPLALCLLILPFPEHMGDPFGLVKGTSALTEQGLHVLGRPVLRHGTVFITQAGFVGISQNCSGLSAFHAAMALALLLALCARSGPRRIALLLLPYPTILLLNSMRAGAMVEAVRIRGPAFLESPLHGLSGLLVIWVAFAVLWLCADRKALRESLS